MPASLADREEIENLATLRERAEHAPKGEAPAAWEAYHARCRAEGARRDKLRTLHTAAARALGERLGRLPGVVIEEAEADDFGRAELRLTINGARRWTRPVRLDEERGYARLRDAIAAVRRRDGRRAWNWLSNHAPARSWCRWDGIEKLRFARNEYGFEQWR